ncbi:MAG: ethanolamine ammonia-lyase reactivating factor EutA [Gammaproteobacteria bacterium]|nr:ethanolamine ammonia-lyase reactivating factor EutA [Gammaproteobacteria bacterium]NNC77187.1 recombinase [Woeseiaceae bacterium]
MRSLFLTHYHPDPDHTPDDPHIEVEYDGPIEEHPLWQRDNVVLTSVGIDIGSAGTQILFSKVRLRRQSVDLSTRYLVVERTTLFESPVSLTPYESETLIDARGLGEIVDAAYYAARLHPDDIDTGVVILTGEALRRENSEPIARILSEKCGDLVCATAGHHMEAMLAAHGSGAAAASFERDERILNLDIGGGTSKLSVIDKGRVISTAAIHVGGRLLAVNASGELERMDPAGRTHANRAGISCELGDRLSTADLTTIAESMADDLVHALTSSLSPRDADDLYLTDPIEHLDNIDALVCSGGVAEYIYRREEREFGDLGKQLGHALRTRIDSGALPWPLLPDSKGIRATALGCSEFTAQLSGNTGYISNEAALLPRRNLKVLRPEFEFGDKFEPRELAAAILQHATMYEVDLNSEQVVLAFHWTGPPQYRRVHCLAEGIRIALQQRIANRLPVYIILDADIAMNLGAILHHEMDVGSDIMVVDGLALWNFDSVDIGKLRQPSMTVPVTIKSLIFNDVVGGAHRRELVHHPRKGESTH